MTAEMSVCVCADAVKAETAKNFLLNRGYPSSGITVEQVKRIIYDAVTHDGGTNDNLENKFVVIGRK